VRKIKVGRLLLSGIVYRLHIVIIQSVFWYVFNGVTLDVWEWKWAISSSIAWNVLNTILYYNYHYWFARLFKLGRRGDGDD